MALSPKSDLPKCEGIDCAFKQTCGRFLRPVGAFQTWHAFYALADDDCAYFEPILQSSGAV